jgi:hypothetical protein
MSLPLDGQSPPALWPFETKFGHNSIMAMHSVAHPYSGQELFVSSPPALVDAQPPLLLLNAAN